MKRIVNLLAVVMLFSTVCTTVKADNYRALVKKMIGVNTSTAETSGQMKKVVQQVCEAMAEEISKNDSLTEAQKAEVETSFKNYVDKNFDDAIVDLMMPCYKKYLTEEQLAEYIALIQQPEVQTANSKMEAATMQWAMMMLGHFMNAMAGKEVTIPAEKACPSAEYKKNLDIYIQKGGLKDLFSTSLNSTLEARLASVPAEQQEKVKEFIIGMMEKIYPAVEMDFKNLIIDNITEAELAILVNLVSNPTYNSAMEATKCLATDQNNMQQWVANFMGGWAKELGIE